jgi:hypothetical protein
LELQYHPLLKVAYSQKKAHFGSNFQKKVPNQSPKHYPHKKDTQVSDLAPVFGDWSQRKKYSKG